MNDTARRGIPKSFVTSFGDTIELNPAYGAVAGKFVRRDGPDELFQQYSKPVPPMKAQTFMAKHFEACWTFDSIRRAAIPLSFRNMLDLGSGFATLPRVAHARGYARDVTALDLFPYGQTALSGARTKALLAVTAVAAKLGMTAAWGPTRKWSLRAAADNFRFPWRAGGGTYSYKVGDIYQHEGSYDWIHSSSTFNHFDHRRILAKLADLLEDGGLLTFTVEGWWYPFNSTQISGYAPYMCQRLTKSDLLRYFREVHPDIDVGHVERVYDTYADPTYPTASTYIDTARQYGLHPVVVQRHMPTRSQDKRAGVAPFLLEREFGAGALDALGNIRRFRPDVTLEDLYTAHYLLGFRKVATPDKR